MKKLAVILVSIVVLAAIIGGGVYVHYKNSPLYSLKQAATAFQNGDKELSKKYVDFEKIIDNVLQEAFAKDEEYKDLKDNPFAVGLIELIKAPLAASIQAAIQNELSSAQKGENTKSIEVKSAKVLSQNKKDSTVEIILSDSEKKDVKLVLGLVKVDDYWKVVKIENLDELNFDKMFSNPMMNFGGDDETKEQESSEPEQEEEQESEEEN